MNPDMLDSTEATRFSPITTNNHVGYLWIVTILGIIYTVLSACLRAYIKWGVYGWDDLCIAVATILHLGQSIIIFGGLEAGIGRTETAIGYSSERASRVSALFFHREVLASIRFLLQKAFLDPEILSLVALCLSKCSVIAMMLRVWTKDVDVKRWAACFTILTLSISWGIGSILTLKLNCNPALVLATNSLEQCPNQVTCYSSTVLEPKCFADLIT